MQQTTSHAGAVRPSFRREFLTAVADGGLARVRELLMLDPALADAVDDNGISALMLAAYRGHEPLTATLFASRGNWTPCETVAFGAATVLRERLDAQPDLIHSTACDGYTLLGLAAFFGHVDCVVVLLQRGADPNARSRNGVRMSPLHSALRRPRQGRALAVLRLLLAAGADPDIADSAGYKPLHLAAAHGTPDLVDALLDAGANIAQPARDGRTPLAVACRRGHERILARFAECLRQRRAGFALMAH